MVDDDDDHRQPPHPVEGPEVRQPARAHRAWRIWTVNASSSAMPQASESAISVRVFTGTERYGLEGPPPHTEE